VMCLSNLRQAGLSAGAYAADNKEYPMGQIWRPASQAIPAHYGPHAVRPPWTPSNHIIVPQDSLSQTGYTPRKVEGMWSCPRLENASMALAQATSGARYGSLIYHYATNGLHGHYDDAPANTRYRNNRYGPYRTIEIRKPSQVWMLFDARIASNDNGTFRPVSFYATGAAELPGQEGSGRVPNASVTHGSGLNVLYWDGHASFFSYGDVNWSSFTNATLFANWFATHHTADGSGVIKAYP
jgi:prepilin-type processing-associated H-X9-DG protein